MKRWKKIVGFVLLIAVIAGSYGLYLYTKKPPDTRKMKARADISAKQLLEEFKTDETKAGEKYIDKVIIVSGTVGTIEKKPGQATLTFRSDDPLSSVVCSFYSDELKSLEGLAEGKEIRVKGNCTGMLSDVILNKCSVVD